MNYTDIEEEPPVDLSFLSRLLLLRDTPLPDVDPLPEDPALEVLDDAKQRYLDCVDRMSRAIQTIERKQADLDTLVGLIKKLGDAKPYSNELEAIISRFEHENGLVWAKKTLADTTAEYKSLRKVFELVDEPNRYLCFTCLNRSIDHVFIPCGHTVCGACLPQLRSSSTCPFCRSYVQNTFKLFLG